jgi:hypothetical protein
MSELRRTRYVINAEIARNALGIPSPVIEWQWQGRGFRGELLARHLDEVIPGDPRPQMTAVSEVWSRSHFENIYTEFLEGFFTRERVKFVTMTSEEISGVGMLWIDLNREEG